MGRGLIVGLKGQLLTLKQEDFIKEETVKVLDEWLGPHEEWDEEFDNIDLTNKKGEGKVLFKV